MPLSPDEKYMYVCVYTVVVDRLLCSVFSTAHTKSKLPKLVTAQNEKWMDGLFSQYVLSDGIQVHLLCPKSLAGYKLIHTLNQTAYHLSD